MSRRKVPMSCSGKIDGLRKAKVLQKELDDAYEESFRRGRECKVPVSKESLRKLKEFEEKKELDKAAETTRSASSTVFVLDWILRDLFTLIPNLTHLEMTGDGEVRITTQEVVVTTKTIKMEKP